MLRDEYSLFVERIKRLTDVDLAGYKEKQMKRRIESLMNRRGFQSFLAYHEHLASDRQALNEFLDRITINVSEFFRNSERWTVLKERVLPTLAERGKDRRLQLWSAACSSGEEPYSLAMLMHDAFPRHAFNLLATDIDQGILARAQTAHYAEGQLSQLPATYRTRFIEKSENGFTIAPAIRDSVSFKIHNLLSDPYPFGQDLIICRNVLIYFTDEIKAGIYKRFAESLTPGGILFVGSTEQIFRPREFGFRVFDSFFYQKL